LSSGPTRHLNTVAVTGASGFVGRHVAAGFERAGFQVRAFSRQSTGPLTRSMNYLDCDQVARAIQGSQSLVHIAGLAHVPPGRLLDPDHSFHEANVQVAVSIAKACIKAGVQKLVLLSSAGVLGCQSPPGGFDDSSPPDPYDPYTRSKLEGESRVSELAVAANLAVAIVRPPMLYGPNAPGTFGRMRTWIERGWPLPLGGLDQRRSFLGVRNLCDAMVHTVNGRIGGVETMLVTDPEPMTAADFARQIARHMGRRSRIVSVPAWLLRFALTAAGRGDDFRRLACAFELRPSRIQALLGWRAPYPVDDELAWSLRSATPADLGVTS
jgi:nucleoside-diphosphate-sugar epimerase